MNSLICVDASVVVRLLIGGPGADRVVTLWQKWQASERPLIAPSLLYYEIVNALHQYVQQGFLESVEFDEALQIALALNIRIYHDATLHVKAANIARTFDLVATYDAHYLALAQQIGAELWTADQRLIRKAADKVDFVRGIVP